MMPRLNKMPYSVVCQNKDHAAGPKKGNMMDGRG